MAKKAASAATMITISPPNLKVAEFTIEGTAPLVQSKFSYKSQREMMMTQQAGSTAGKGKQRTAKDFDTLYQEAMHDGGGWRGIPAPAFRNALISACRVCGFAMTRAKLSVFVLADGYDINDKTALVKITKGKPQKHVQTVRNASGVCDLRSQAMWEPGWQCKVRVRFDADQFTLADVANLLMRAGIQVGVGCGRPDSKDSCGLGYGTFQILNQKEA